MVVYYTMDDIHNVWRPVCHAKNANTVPVNILFTNKLHISSYCDVLFSWIAKKTKYLQTRYKCL